MRCVAFLAYQIPNANRFIAAQLSIFCIARKILLPYGDDFSCPFKRKAFLFNILIASRSRGALIDSWHLVCQKFIKKRGRRNACVICLRRDQSMVANQAWSIELIDPSLSNERLIYRLFHERGVRVFKSMPVAAQCSCSHTGVEAMLRSFSQDDRDDMVENGMISVKCEFCSANYQFNPDEVRAAPARGQEGATSSP